MADAAPAGRFASRPAVGEQTLQRACAALSLLAVGAPVVYLAWHRGGVDFDASAPVFVGVLALLSFICWLEPLLGLPVANPWPVALLPLLPLLQLVPLGSAQAFSLLPEERFGQFAAFGVEPWSAASIYPYATLRASLVLAGCCALFVLARSAVSAMPRAFWPLGAPLALLGATEAVIGVAQHLQAASLDNTEQWVASGTLVNRGHYAALLEACLGVSLGWGFAQARDCSWRKLHLAAGAAATFAAAGVCLLGIVLSFSRAGIAVAVVMLAAAVFLVGRVSRRAVLIVAGIVVAVSMTAWTLDAAGLADRFAGLVQGDADARLAIWRDSWRTAKDYLWTGSGLGTFAFAFQRSEMVLPLKTIDHAHSDYLQALVELGLPGAALILGLLAALLWRTGRRIGHMKSLRCRALAMGCWMGAGGVLMHAAVDFPLQIPAIAALVAVLAGAASGLTEEGRARHAVPRRLREARGLRAGTTTDRSLTVTARNLVRGDMGGHTGPPMRRSIPRKVRWVAGAASLVYAVLGIVLLTGRAEERNAESLLAKGTAAMVDGRWEEADALLRQSLNANPYAAAVWLKRAEIAEARGEPERGTRMARVAQSLEPYTLRVEWPVAQSDLRAGNFEDASRSLGRLAWHIPAMRATIYEAAWRAGMPPKLIIDRVVPGGAEAAGEYLCYLARRDEWAQIMPAYRALVSPHEKAPPAEMLRYVARRLSEARRDVEGRQFAALMRQGQVPTQDPTE